MKTLYAVTVHNNREGYSHSDVFSTQPKAVAFADAYEIIADDDDIRKGVVEISIKPVELDSPDYPFLKGQDSETLEDILHDENCEYFNELADNMIETYKQGNRKDLFKMFERLPLPYQQMFIRNSLASVPQELQIKILRGLLR